MTFSTKLAAGVMLAAATSTALTGCGKAKATGHTSASMSMSPKASMSMSMSSNSNAGSGSSSNGYVTATIGGKTKHIQAGQMCSQKHASDYTQYGFTCAANSNGTYVLSKN
jgi:hypothetical protein